MCSQFLLFGIFFSVQIFQTSSKITDEEYASMPILFHFDNYDRCMLHDETAIYCMITFQLYSDDPSNSSEVWKVIKEVNSNDNNYRHDLLRHGICLPDVCPDAASDYFKNNSKFRETLSHCYQQKYKHMGLSNKIVKINCETKKSPYPIDNYDIIFGIFAVFYVIFVIIISLCLEIVKYRSKESYQRLDETSFGKILVTFSIFKNWNRLLQIDLENPNIKSLRCIQGLRFYNMILVIAAHTLMVNVAVPVTDPLYTEQVPTRWISIFLSNGGFVVQTFFLMSAFLLTFNFFDSFDGKESIAFSWFLLALINRYIRLTPPLAVIIALHSTWLVHFSRGPLWDPIIGEEYRRCRENWWTNLLYVNNHVNNERMCMIQTWYLAADTHFFIVGLLILMLIWRKPTRIYFISGMIIILHVFILFFVIYWNNWESFVRLKPEIEYMFKMIEHKQWHATTGSSYSNCAGFAVGLSLGYIYFKYRNKKLFTRKIYLIIWWIAVWALIVGTVLFLGLILFSENYEYDPLFAAIYGSVSRTLFALGIGLFLLGLIYRTGWIAKWACEWTPTYALGRLTYCAYLIHTISVKIRAGSKRSPNYLTDDLLVMEIITDITIAYLGAVGLTLFVEMPIYTLGKQFIKKSK